jgi:hypothetical protein
MKRAALALCCATLMACAAHTTPKTPAIPGSLIVDISNAKLPPNQQWKLAGSSDAMMNAWKVDPVCDVTVTATAPDADHQWTAEFSLWDTLGTRDKNAPYRWVTRVGLGKHRFTVRWVTANLPPILLAVEKDCQ